MDRVDHDGRTTAYRVVGGDGDGPRTLYVHGSGGSHRVWGHQCSPDGPARPASALDLSGHGDSEDLDGDRPVLRAYARDVAAVADVVDADALVGSSLGGAVVLQSVLDGAVDPGAIVLAGTGSRLPVDEELRSLLAEDFDAAIDRLHGEDVLFHDADDRTVERSKATMRDAGQAIVRSDFAACDAFDVTDRLDEIAVPALAVVGEYDRLTPPAFHRTLATEMPDCEYRELSDAAHLAMLDRPAAFNAVLADFFDGIRWKGGGRQ